MILEDDDEVREGLAAHFIAHGNTVFAVPTLAGARDVLSKHSLDAVILDLLLPDGEGLELFEIHALPPVIILSSLSADENVLDGLQAGATDYCVKPCSPSLVEARLALRLLPKQEAEVAGFGLLMNLNTRTVTAGGKDLALTGIEFNILHFFMTHPGEYYRQSEIYEQIWHAPALNNNTVKYHIFNLRQKLTQATGKTLISARYGMGYAFGAGDEK